MNGRLIHVSCTQQPLIKPGWGQRMQDRNEASFVLLVPGWMMLQPACYMRDFLMVAF